MKPEYAVILAETVDWLTVWALEDARRVLVNSRLNGTALKAIEQEIQKRKKKHGAQQYDVLRRNRYIIPDLTVMLSRTDAEA